MEKGVMERELLCQRGKSLLVIFLSKCVACFKIIFSSFTFDHLMCNA